jgi:hypothetical protein
MMAMAYAGRNLWHNSGLKKIHFRSITNQDVCATIKLTSKRCRMCRSIDDVRKYLKEHGKEIGGKAENGDVLCAQIVSAYDLLFHRPTDPGPQGLLVGMIHDYQKRAFMERAQRPAVR